MKQFFKFFFASTLGVLFAAFLLTIIGFGIIASLVDKELPIVKEASILHFKPGMGIEERSSDDLSNFDVTTFQIKKEQGLAEILSTLKSASSDDRIKGMYLELTPTFMAGFSTLKEIHDALRSFRDSGKFIVAYSSVLSETGYYLASTADEVLLNPSGTMLFNGMYADVWFYKEALGKLGVEFQVFKHGTFKSAVEPYILNEMSPANRLQVERYVESLFSTYLNDIAPDRKLSADSLRLVSNGMLIRNPKDAIKYGLVDKLAAENEVRDILAKRMEIDNSDDLPFISMDTYAEANPPKKKAGAGRIAVLYADGVIQDDGQGRGVMTPEEMLAALKEIREDDDIKALVLRVNSPGGSALASDVIYRELLQLKGKIPIIVSMGDVAASGGYYIACMADTIVAHPNTITGSIGVFGLMPNMQGLLNDKLGIHTDGVKTGEFSDLGRIDRPLTEAEKAIIQGMVEDTYREFVTIVAAHRNIPLEAMDSIAEGRVWTGNDALRMGLVDVIGGFPLAVELARERAGLTEYRLVAYPQQSNPLAAFFGNEKKTLTEQAMKEQFGEHYRILLQYQRAMSMKGIQMRLPFEISVQ